MQMDLLSLLKAAFESTADGLLIVDLQGRVVHFNHRFQELWNIPPEVLATKDDEKLISFILDQLIGPDDFIGQIRALYQNTEAHSKDQIKFKDGRVFERLSRPLRMDETTIGRIWSFSDVTEHHQREEVLTAITDLSPDIISIVGADGKLLFNSKAAERIHGYAPNELIGQVTLNLIHPEDQAMVAEKMQELLAGPGHLVTAQYRYRNQDGSYCWMEATATSQIDNPLIRGIVTISRDITARKQLENELNSALKLRDEFISITSHELKTPLTSMKLQLQMLKRSKRPLLPTQEAGSRAENLDKFIGQVQVLQRLIDDLLSITRIRAGMFSMDFQQQDLSETVLESIDLFQEVLKDAGCNLLVEIEPGLILKHDKQRFQQVVSNLLSNAAKYAPGRPVEVVLRREGSEALLWVRDQGPGVPSGQEQKIFGLFDRSDSVEKIPGLGIGLYLSRCLVEQHGGRIEVESPDDGGARFMVRLRMDEH
jgi:two-component system, sensor histidine kinase and response regulator